MKLLTVVALLTAAAAGAACAWMYRELQSTRQDVNRLLNEAASAQKVDARFNNLQAQINTLSAGNGGQPGGAPSGNAGSHRVELLVGYMGQSVPALRYVGTSFRDAMEKGQNQAAPSAALAQAVKIDGKNPCFGTVQFVGMNRFAPGQESKGGNTMVLSVARPTSDSNAWDLTAEARDTVRRQTGEP